MIKKSFRLMLLAAFALSSVMFVSCNKWEDEINELDSKVAALEQTVSSLKAAVDGGAVISSVSNTSEGVKFTLSNGQSYTVTNGATGATGAAGQDGKDGQDGKPGSVVTIGENGNWFIDGVDQNVSAVGASTFVVDCGSYFELNVVEKVDGENSEIVKINLPKTKAINSIAMLESVSPLRYADDFSPLTVDINYGITLGKNDKKEFNGVTYTKQTLVAKGSTIAIAVNPIDADATLYNFELVDTKGNSPYVISEVKAHKSAGALTRATATANAGIYVLSVDYADGNFDTDDIADRNDVLYALTTATAEGTVATNYQFDVNENKVTTASFDYEVAIDDEKERVIDLEDCINDASEAVDYYFEIVDKTAAAAMGAQLNGSELTATKEGKLNVYVHYFLVDGTIAKGTIEAEFKYITPSGSGLDAITWTVQKDDNNKDNGVETEYVYLPMAAVKAALVGNSDNAIPTVKVGSITWADGEALNKKSVVVNGAYFGKAVSGKTVTTINTADIATVDANPYVWDATANNKKGAYVQATDINKDLFVKVNFNSQTALVGDYTVNVEFTKAGESNATVSVPVALSIVAPENVIVKNAPYFNGDNAVVYGVANGATVAADLDDLFTTTGLTYEVTKIKQTSSSTKADYSPWLGANGAITVPVKATGNANYCVGTTQEFTATKLLFPRVEAATYKFNVTVKSPVVVSYTGAAKVIDNDPIYIAVDEFTGKTVKTGAAIYLGTIDYADANATDRAFDAANLQSVTVAADAKDENSKYITVKANSFNNGTVVSYKDAEGNVVYTAQAVEVVRVAGIALQSPVTCKVNVTVKDMWGVETVIPVNVTVNPIQ